jgi:nucleoid-associated protein YgaU
MTPQQPTHPADLSLQPSRGAGTGTRPDFSNVQGHSDTVPASGPTGDRAPDFSNVQGDADTVPASADRTYTVQAGDTLSHIAQAMYGKASRWHAIFEANRDQLQDPDLIRPGQVLRIPSAD